LGSSAVLTVSVPSEAKIYVNNKLTSTPGAERQYVSRGLDRGYSYKYQVRAEIERDGEILTQTKVVDLKAGDSRQLAFDFDAPETTLTVHVPENATVFLAGNKTSSTGPVRVFTTSTLSAGQAWDDYTIEVKYEKDGVMLTKDETISLKAGESRELNFSFDEPKIADAR
jgi:uncharacterized protein (TIGR03000 family)